MVKAKEFRIPYKWQERHIAIQDQVWFLPPNVPQDPFVFAGWEQSGLFDTKRPVRIEYCSGNGTWIAEKALADPASNWLAVEKQMFRARLIWARAKSLALTNLAVALAEGYELTKRFIPDASVDEVFVNFPDPWPKRRHGKHRIINAAFTKELSRIVKPSGTVTLVTDDEEYSNIMIAEMAANEQFESLFQAPFYQEPPSDYGTSYFDSLFRNQTKIIRYHRFERK